MEPDKILIPKQKKLKNYKCKGKTITNLKPKIHKVERCNILITKNLQLT